MFVIKRKIKHIFEEPKWSPERHCSAGEELGRHLHAEIYFSCFPIGPPGLESQPTAV